jgi:hypothetical protein
VAKTPAKNDRRAVVDSIRKKQKGAERTRGYVIVAVCAVIAVVIVAAAGWGPITSAIRTSHANAEPLADVGKSPSAAGCSPYVTLKADGNQQHEPTGTIITYTTAPPAFGPHWNEAGVAPVAMARKFYSPSDRPPLEALVHNLEHGYTIVWYDDTVAKNNSELDLIRSLGDHFAGTDDWRDKFIAVPWTAADEKATYKAGDPMTQFPAGKHIAFTHWSAGGTPVPTLANGNADTSKQVGVFEYCSGVSGAALKQFMEDYPFTDSPEPNAM